MDGPDLRTPSEPERPPRHSRITPRSAGRFTPRNGTWNGAVLALPIALPLMPPNIQFGTSAFAKRVR